MSTSMTPLANSNDFEVETSPSPKKSGCNRCSVKSPRKRVAIIVVVTAVLAVVVGFLIGYFVPKKKDVYRVLKPSSGATKDIHDTFEGLVSGKELAKELRFFTTEPHVAGSERHKALIEHIETKWREYGFDEVEIPEYQVLLSVPQDDQPNTVEILDNGAVEYTILGKINVTTKVAPKRSFPYFPYIAFAPPGEVEGELVYCNGGSEEDLQLLDRRNISVKDRIVLLRGHGATLTAAANRGAIGAILYVDPATVAKDGSGADQTYPETAWMSKKAVFSKTITQRNGDQLTPHIPAITGMYRKSRNETELANIPVQPISYEDAIKLLSRLGGDEVPAHWRGTLKVTYRFGPGFTKPGNKVRLRVHNKLVVKTIFNVIGTINGREEPDRYVLVGNHRDSEFFGAADASSGSAALMEIARVLGKLKSDGWQPRRTVKLCSWGAEEFGMVGSVEWVEEHTKLLMDRAVVYWNTDVAVGGNYVVFVQTCPMLAEAIFCRAKKVDDPNNKSIYDNMLDRFGKSIDYPGEPYTLPYLYFSDYLPFYMSIGVPAADFSYFFGDKKHGTFLYPVYHTQEDSYYWVKEFADPEFAYHAAMTKLVGGLVLDFSDAVVLEFNVMRYAKAVERSFKRLEAHPLFNNVNVSTTFVQNAIDKFINASTLFQAAKDKLTGDEGQLVLRTINDQLIQVERAFLSPYMKLDDPMMQHVFSRDTPSGIPAGNSFPGVVEALENAKETGNTEEVKKQLSLVAEASLSAADIIKPVVCK